MRWQELFADLEGQAEAMSRAERGAEIDDRTRAEVARLHWVDRARVASAQPLRLRVAGGLGLAGRLDGVGPDWLLLDEGQGREALVPVAAVVGLRGLPRYASPPDSAGIVKSRLGLRAALRGLARDRSTVRLHRGDGSVLDGVLDRVGADFVDVATLAPGEVRRRGDVRDVELVPMPAIAAVRRSI